MYFEGSDSPAMYICMHLSDRRIGFIWCGELERLESVWDFAAGWVGKRCVVSYYCFWVLGWMDGGYW